MDKIVQITEADESLVELELAEHLHAGFPSPAGDYTGDRIDLAREMVRHPETTFYARVEGDSMQDAGIFSGDIVVVDRSLTAQQGDYVVAYVDGEFTLKEYRYDEAEQCVWLIPHNPHFSPIRVTPDDEFVVWGVVTHSVHKILR